MFLLILIYFFLSSIFSQIFYKRNILKYRITSDYLEFLSLIMGLIFPVYILWIIGSIIAKYIVNFLTKIEGE